MVLMLIVFDVAKIIIVIHTATKDLGKNISPSSSPSALFHGSEIPCRNGAVLTINLFLEFIDTLVYFLFGIGVEFKPF